MLYLCKWKFVGRKTLPKTSAFTRVGQKTEEEFYRRRVKYHQHFSTLFFSPYRYHFPGRQVAFTSPCHIPCRSHAACWSSACALWTSCPMGEGDCCAPAERAAVPSGPSPYQREPTVKPTLKLQISYEQPKHQLHHPGRSQASKVPNTLHPFRPRRKHRDSLGSHRSGQELHLRTHQPYSQKHARA